MYLYYHIIITVLYCKTLYQQITSRFNLFTLLDIARILILQCMILQFIPNLNVHIMFLLEILQMLPIFDGGTCAIKC